MSRFVDSLPAPEKPRYMKVVSLTMSRNGTNGLYTALKILGFKPYHVVEMLPNGIPHLKMVGEATRAVRTDRGRYSRADFDKLLGEYDAACVPFFIEDLVRAYPDAKFVLITREPQAWLTSMKKTVIKAAKEQGRFPATLFQYLDPTMWHFRRMTEAWISLWWPSGNIDDDEEAFRTYDKHNRLARGLVPPERRVRRASKAVEKEGDTESPQQRAFCGWNSRNRCRCLVLDGCHAYRALGTLQATPFWLLDNLLLRRNCLGLLSTSIEVSAIRFISCCHAHWSQA
ncbi:hypothetical protein QBC46DRAFT_400573 [Diplogelasinospora grovesii]|uniref:Uncharacterized protein n=1 Tax=Diplogelasinospora grovesii TaxID=303347 RepID=A0AAN6MV97_9PEZI|nr:hypothetical protein QBC46DRAFT_400573 [Diplogelasinospora grovesii]